MTAHREFAEIADTLYGSCEVFAKRVREITDNKLEIQVFAPGEIVLAVFDAVQVKASRWGTRGAVLRRQRAGSCVWHHGAVRASTHGKWNPGCCMAAAMNCCRKFFTRFDCYGFPWLTPGRGPEAGFAGRSSDLQIRKVKNRIAGLNRPGPYQG
jgi:hypothetical protein